MKYSASVICMDPLNLRDDILLLDGLKIDSYHLDIMDNVGVPRLGLYPEIAEGIARISKTPMNVHLMVTDPESIIPIFGAIPNVREIWFHTFGDNETNIYRIADRIRGLNKIPGIALNLSEAPSVYLDRMDCLDSVLVMGIHPGVLKQRSRPASAKRKVEAIALEKSGTISVDGGVSFESALALAEAGADELVVGSSTLFTLQVGSRMHRDENIAYNLQRLRMIS